MTIGTRVRWANHPVTPPRPGRQRYLEQDKRDVIALMDGGWHPYDIAVAYDIPIYRNKTTGAYQTKVYQLYDSWLNQFSLETVRSVRVDIST